MKTMFSGWFGFWIFMTVYIICEAVMYMNGHDTAFWSHRTPEEKQLQQNIINNPQGESK